MICYVKSSASMDKRMGVWKLAVFFLIVAECNLSNFPTVSAQTSGSISVDCGSDANYVDSVTNISWVPDDEYITTGVNGDVPSAQTYYPDFSEFKTVRYFPDSLAKNCYRFAAMPNMTHMIRGTFFYGSYDNATKLPSFQMAVDGTVVANVTFDDPTKFVYHEITFMTQLNNVSFLCLLRDSSNSVPFISAISFWSLPDGFWNPNVAPILGEGVYLKTKYRLNFGGNDLIRHPDDAFDRYWFPTAANSTFLQSTISPVQRLTTSSLVDVVGLLGEPPESVMDTALTSSPNMTISFPDTYSYQYVLSFYYAELDSTANATSRQFYLVMPGDPNIHLFNPFPMFLGNSDLSWYDTFTPGSGIHMYEDKNSSSTMGPLANALELFEISTNHMARLTNDQDALAIEEIKSQMNLTEWTGDPCLPVPHSWVTCSALGNPSCSIQAV
jgi:hypothetical protein